MHIITDYIDIYHIHNIGKDEDLEIVMSSGGAYEGLEEAVKKMTSLTAKRFNLVERGVVRVGAWADLVLFDERTVIDKATFADPHQYPEGIPYVIVNGEIVLDQGEHTGALPGRVL